MLLSVLSWRVSLENIPCHIHLPVCMWIIDPHSRAPKKNTSHGNEVLSQILHISHKDHVANEEVRAKIQQAIGPHEDLLTIVKRRKLQWYGHVSRSSGPAKTILQGTVKGGRRQGRQNTEEEVGRQHQGIDRPRVRQVPEGSGEQGKMEKTGCKIICSAPTTLAVKGLMMMIMRSVMIPQWVSCVRGDAEGWTHCRLAAFLFLSSFLLPWWGRDKHCLDHFF